MSQRVFDWVRLVLLALAVAGLLLSMMLVRMHAGEALPDSLAWVCGGPKDCNKVVRGPLSELRIFPPRPIPVATIGMAYFTVLGAWLLMVGRLPGKLRRMWVMAALIGLGGLAGSAWMIYIMGWKLETWCRACVATHAINVPLVLGIWALWLRHPKGDEDEAAASCSGGYAWKVPLLALLAGVAVGLAQVREAQTSSALRLVEQEANRADRLALESAEKVEIPVGPDDPVLGPASAPHTVVVFSDFQCPACAQFASVIKEVQKRLAAEGPAKAAKAGKAVGAGEVMAYAPFKIVFKHFPLNADCNPHYKPLLIQLKHDFACDAARAAEAARILGGNEAFWKMHDLLFANRAELPKQPYRKLAERIGLDPVRFEEVRQAESTLARIQADAAQGRAIGVASSTPAIYLDGRRVSSSVRTFDTQDPMGRTVELWRQMLSYSAVLSKRERIRAAASQPGGAASTQPATQPGAVSTRPALRPVRVVPGKAG